MTLQQTIKSQIIEAMRAKDAVRLSTLRGLSSAMTNELVNLKRMPQDELSDEEALAVIRKAAKQHKDSIAQFETAGRPELAEDEKAELAILETYLPQMMGKDEVMKIAQAKMTEFGIDVGLPVEARRAQSGKLMSALMKDLKGKADGTVVKEVVEEILG